MLFTSFFRQLQEDLLSALPNAADIELIEDSGVRTLSVRTGADLLFPLISLENFFAAYQKGSSMEDICGRILNIYLVESLQPFYTASDLPDCETMLKGLALRPSSLRPYRRLMPFFPHTVRHGLLFFYTVSLSGECAELGSSLLTDEVYRHYRLNDDLLYRTALRNMTVSSPAVICSLHSFLDRLCAETPDKNLRVDLPADVLFRESFHVLTNESAHFGAASVLYPGMPEKLYKRFGAYYLLPSSVHEMLILPQKGAGPLQELQTLIRTVNRSISSSLTVLSDDLYAYDPEKGLHIC